MRTKMWDTSGSQLMFDNYGGCFASVSLSERAYTALFDLDLSGAEQLAQALIEFIRNHPDVKQPDVKQPDVKQPDAR